MVARECIWIIDTITLILVMTYPLPKLDELVEQAAGQQFYATFDMREAHFQIQLDENSRDLTTFSDGVTLYRFRRLPFGLKLFTGKFFLVIWLTC